MAEKTLELSMYLLALSFLLFFASPIIAKQVLPPATGEYCFSGSSGFVEEMLLFENCWGISGLLSGVPKNDAATWTTHPFKNFHITRREITVDAYIRCTLDNACDLFDIDYNDNDGDSGCTYPFVMSRVLSYIRELEQKQEFSKIGQYKQLTPTTQADQKLRDETMSLSEDYPINCINFSGAKNVCKWLGGRVCTESEWNAACSGPYSEDNPYPYGKEFVKDTCHVGKLLPFGQNLECKGGLHNLYDMGGSLSEWVADDETGQNGAIKIATYYTVNNPLAKPCTGPVVKMRNDVKQALTGVRCCADAVELLI